MEETLASTIILRRDSDEGEVILHLSAWVREDGTETSNTKYMSLVKDITDEINTTVSVTPIVTYDAENSFAFDIKSTETFSISFSRRNPVGDGMPNDSSDDDRDWSNREWINNFVKYINRWQFRTDGNIMTYVPVNPEFQLYLSRRVYIKSLTYTYSSSSPELVTGSMTLQVGSSKGTANVDDDSPDTLNVYRDESTAKNMDDLTIYVSSSDRLVEYSLYTHPDEATEYNDIHTSDPPIRNAVISYTVKEGPEQPFGYIKMELSKKRLSVIAPNLIGDLVAGKNRIRINAMGKGEYIVTKCKTTDDTFTLTGYTIYEVYRSLALTTDMIFKQNATPISIIKNILSTSWNVSGVTQSPIYITPDNVVYAYKESNNTWGGGYTESTGYFTAQTSVWYIMTLCAIKLNCKIWFSEGKVYVIDTSLPWDHLWNGHTDPNDPSNNVNSNVKSFNDATDIHNLYLNMNDVYPLAPSEKEVNFSKAICGSVELGSEGAETICNLVQVEFNSDLDTNDPTLLKVAGLKKGLTVTGLTLVTNPITGVNSYQIKPVDCVQQSINTYGKKILKLSLPELSLSDAQDIADKYAAAYCDSEQSIGFTMRELHYLPQNGGNVIRLWQRYFPQITRVDDIYDYSHDLVDKNISNYQYNDGTSTAFHKMRNKLCMSTYEHHFPEGTTDYWFGIMKPTDLTQNTSEIMNSVYKQ